MCSEEWYDVVVADRNGGEVSYTIHYSKEENCSGDTFEVLDEEGTEVPEGELKNAIIEAFETCTAH